MAGLLWCVENIRTVVGTRGPAILTGEMVHLDELDNFIVRLADEGVPIGAISRVTKLQPPEFRPILRDALSDGRILEMPREDWPPLDRRNDRVQGVSADTARRTQARHKINDDDTVLIGLADTFKTTRLQSKMFLKLLRRGMCTKEMLHDTVEENRGRPDEPTDDKIVQVMICHLRKKLRHFAIKITTRHGVGYCVSVEDRQRVVEMLTRNVKCPVEHLNIGLDT